MVDIQEIAKKISVNGGRLYIVGGFVRDEILGIKSYDEDYCVTGISFDEFQKLFPEAMVRGKSFPVFDIEGREFAIARRERKTGLGHKNFEVETGKEITIEQDLARRDITINAIAKDVLTGEIIDPYGGIADIKNKTIRAVTEHFKEDPLRVYRVARFAAKLGFDVDDNTLNMMKELRDELHTISEERVYTEFSKALLVRRPSIFFDVLRKSFVLDVHFKPVYDLIEVEQPIEYHPEGDAYNHTMEVLDRVAETTIDYHESRRLEIRFGALVHDFGKGATPKDQYPHHYLHEIRGIEIVKKFGENLKLPNRLIECGKTSCREHMRGGIFNRMKPNKQVEFFERAEKSVLGIDGLQIIVNADNKQAPQFEELGKRCLSEVNGEYIKQRYGLKQGIKFGQKLHEERVLWLKEHR